MPTRRRAHAIAHTVLAVLFALGAVWAAARGWRLASSGAAGSALVIHALAFVGFVSLTARELAAARGARADDPLSAA